LLFYIDERSEERWVLSIHFQKSDAVRACAKQLAMIASLNGGHTH